jgi:hypothetical protein
MDHDQSSLRNSKEHENQPQRSKSNPCWKFGGTLGAIVLFFTIKFVISYTSSELHVKSTQDTTWDDKFRNEFVNSCAGSAKKEVAAEFSPVQLQDSRIKKMIDLYSLSFCKCSSKAIEENQVIATKYNRIDRSIAQAQQESAHKLANFMATREGSKVLEACRERAIQVAKQ